MIKYKNTQYVFIDSGIGGIPYLKRLKEIAPHSNCVYIADTKNFPYGDKTFDEVISCTVSLVSKAISLFNPSVIILACNTMTVSALSHLRKNFTTPFVGTVPAIKPASSISRNKKIALLATERTINDIYVQKLIDRFGLSCKFFMCAASSLVKEIETSLLNADEKDKLNMIEPSIQFFKDCGVDTAVLGCTHFLHLRNAFKKACSPEINIIDSLDGVVNQALKISPPKFFKNNLDTLPDNVFYITSNRKQKEYASYADFFNMKFEYLK